MNKYKTNEVQENVMYSRQNISFVDFQQVHLPQPLENEPNLSIFLQRNLFSFNEMSMCAEQSTFMRKVKLWTICAVFLN